MTKDPLEQSVVSSSSEIIWEGAAIFTDMTETIKYIISMLGNVI